MTKNCTHWAVSRRHLFHALGPAILLITSTLLPTSADAQGHLKTSAPSQHLKKRHHKEAVKTTVPAPAIRTRRRFAAPGSADTRANAPAQAGSILGWSTTHHHFR